MTKAASLPTHRLWTSLVLVLALAAGAWASGTSFVDGMWSGASTAMGAP